MKISGVVANDMCGPVGGFYTSLTWSFLPGQLSTLNGDEYDVRPFNFTNLPCPSQSILTAHANPILNNPDNHLPYSPLIYPPPQVKMLDPAFKTCIFGRLPGKDPPQALTPHAELNAATTTRHHAASPAATKGPDYPSVFSPVPKQTMMTSVQPRQSRDAHGELSGNDGEMSTKTEHVLSSTASAILASLRRNKTSFTVVKSSVQAESHLDATARVEQPGKFQGEASAPVSNTVLRSTPMNYPDQYSTSNVELQGASAPLDSQSSDTAEATPISAQVSVELKTTAKASGGTAPEGHSVMQLPHGIAIDGSTVEADQTAAIQRPTISLASDKTNIVEGSSIYQLPESMVTGSSRRPESVVFSSAFVTHSTNLDGQADDHSISHTFPIAGDTVAPRPTDTNVDGTTVSPGDVKGDGATKIRLASDGRVLSIGTETISLARTSDPGIGGAIWGVWQGTKTVTEVAICINSSNNNFYGD